MPTPGRTVRWLAAACLVVGTLATLAVVAPSTPVAAAATLTKVQTGTVASAGSGNVTLTLPGASTAGDLLVATVASDKLAAFTGPSGWIRGPNTGNTGGEAEIWYYPNNPGAISSAAFGNGGTHFTGGQLTEWSGAASSGTLDVSASGLSSSAASLAVTSASSTVAAGELGISSFVQGATGAAFTASAGWSQAATKSGGSFTYVSDTQGALGRATVSETVSSNKTAAFAGVIATFEPLCSSGALTLSPPSSISFGAITLSGRDQTTSATAAGTVDDETNSGAGWNLQLTSTLFSNGGGKNLSATATTVTSATASTATGSCAIPINAVTYPLGLPAGSSPPTAAKVFDAAAFSGIGPNQVTLSLTLAVPANTFSGSYNSTWTLSLTSGP